MDLVIANLFRSVSSRIRTKYGEILRIFPYSVRMREKTDRNNSEYRHFLHSVELVHYHVTEPKRRILILQQHAITLRMPSLT